MWLKFTVKSSALKRLQHDASLRRHEAYCPITSQRANLWSTTTNMADQDAEVLFKKVRLGFYLNIFNFLLIVVARDSTVKMPLYFNIFIRWVLLHWECVSSTVDKRATLLKPTVSCQTCRSYLTNYDVSTKRVWLLYEKLLLYVLDFCGRISFCLCKLL